MNIGEYWWLILGIVLIIILLVILIVLKTQLNRDKKLLENGEKVEEKEEKKMQDSPTENKNENTAEEIQAAEQEIQEQPKTIENNGDTQEDDIDFIPVETETNSKKNKKKVSNEGAGDNTKVAEIKEENAEKVETNEEEHKSGVKKVEKYRVTYDKDKKDWVVKKDGAQRATKRFPTKEEATEFAKEIAKKNDTTIAVHKKDGKFQKKH